MRKIFEKKDRRTELEKNLDKEVEKLGTMTSGTRPYDEQLKIVERLSAMVVEQKKAKQRVSPDTIVNGVIGGAEFTWLLAQPYLDNVKARALGLISRGKAR